MLTQKQIDVLPAEVRSHIDVLDACLEQATSSITHGTQTMRAKRQTIIRLQSVIASLLILAGSAMFIAVMEHTTMMAGEVERQRISEELDEAHVNAAALGCDLGRHIEKNID